MSRVKKLKPGRDNMLTDAVILQIKDGIIDGLPLIEIAKNIGVSENTIYAWKQRNNMGLQDKINTWEAMRQLKEADAFSKKLMSMNTHNDDGTVNARLVAIQQKESEFLREKLLIARDKYNSQQVTNINVVLPQPIIDIGKVVATVDKPESLDK